MSNLLHCGKCEDVLLDYDSNTFDAMVTDPPAGIAFMGKEWDKDKGGRNQWIEYMTGIFKKCLRVLKPGAHALVWALPRTSHWTATALENAGFEIRDIVNYIFGSGFPKSLNIGKKIDELQGNEREIFINPKWAEKYPNGNNKSLKKSEKVAQAIRSNKPLMTSKGNSPFEGWGTALKPACEHWILCRKPLSEKTIAKNVLKWETGGINVDGCRIGTERPVTNPDKNKFIKFKEQDGCNRKPSCNPDSRTNIGRFPANVILDDSDEVLAGFPNTKSGGRNPTENNNGNGLFNACKKTVNNFQSSEGSAARFFYCAKASKRDRTEGCEFNNHPTVKSTELMRYLCRLITPPDGIIIDPFMGSGSTGKAAVLEGFVFVGIEQDEEYFKIAEARINYAEETVDERP